MIKDNIYNYGSVTESPSKTNTGDNKISHFNEALYIPNWSSEEFIRLRTKFTKQGIKGNGMSPLTERGTFFYKLFINFDTNTGLFGQIINKNKSKNKNNALTYLDVNSKSDRFSANYKGILANKKNNLENFTKLLNYILEECPWFIKEVGGLAEALKYDLNEVVSGEDKKVSVSFNDDAIDMRVSTLFDLYRSACYDITNQRELIPENLRKFDMAIIMFNSPINGINLGENITDITYRCIVFKNCEFVLESLANIPEVMNNEAGFAGQYSIEISYHRAYSYTVNKELLKQDIFDTQGENLNETKTETPAK